jgi:SAM-dependent methyltransferase
MFNSDYANYYDLFYAEKNYDAETDFLVDAMRRFGSGPLHRILDISSGTGGHAIALARCGFRVTAFDRSPAMIGLARAKLAEQGLQASFRVADMRTFKERGSFDGCISMFDSVNYLSSLEELGSVLERVRNRLRMGGIFVLQAWNGGVVFREGLRKRRHVYSKGDLTIVRVVEPSLDVVDQSCRIQYTIQASRKGRVLRRYKESHRLTIFTLLEIKHLLQDVGLRFQGAFPAYRLDRDLSPTDWSMVLVARR